MKIFKLIILIIVFVNISCKTNLNNSIQIVNCNDEIKLQVIEIEKLLNNTKQFNNLKILFPKSIDTVYKKEGKIISVYFNEDRKWMDSIRNLNKSKVQFIDSYNNNKSKYSIFFNGLFENEYFYKVSYKNNNLIELKIAKDSLINNEIDSVSSVFLTKEYFKNGQLKEIGTTTDYNNQFEGAPVGLHSKYDSLGNLKQTVFYHVNTIDKAYKIITEYNDGKITSKVKTRNDELYEITADTLEVIIK